MQRGLFTAIRNRNLDRIEKFSKKHVLYTSYTAISNYVFGAVYANFIEFSFVLVSFIEIGGIPAN